MFTLKYFVFASLIFAEDGLSLSALEQNKTAEALWNLSNFALQSRQLRKHPYSYKYLGKYPQYYGDYPINSYAQYPGTKWHNHRPNYYTQKEHYPHDYVPSYPHRPLSQQLQQSFMDVLLSVAKNDDLQCVPKIICEVTSGAISGRQQSQNLPINISMESLLGLLSAMNGLQLSPLFHFGKAALQGYASKGNTASCNYAYPQCPSDADELVHYLNNHNGGFFRFFNGIRSQNSQNHLNYGKKGTAEQRIQNNAVDYEGSNFREQKEINFPPIDEEPSFQDAQLKFPSQYYEDNKLKQDYNKFFLYKSQNSLKFPEEDTVVGYDEQPYRKPKELPYDLSHYYSNNNLDLQKPLPNHQASPVIFPVRTGTGELRLDADELSDFKRPYSYEDDDIKITFNGFREDRKENTRDNDIKESRRGFSFPSR